MTDFTLRPLTVPERKYTYAQSSQLQGQTGNIGYLRGDFGSSGDQFYTTWFDTRPQWKSDEFKRDLDDVINALRSEEYGLLQSRSQMVRYLNDDEYSRVIQSLIRLKNSLIAQGRYTDGVDDVLCKVLSAKKRKVKIKYF